MRMALMVQTVERRQQVEVGALALRSHAGRRSHVEDRRAFGTQRRSLKMRGQKAVRPVGGPALRVGHIGQHDEGGQVLVFGAESVGSPRADRRIAAELVAGVQVIERGRMVDALRFEPAIEADIVDDARRSC